MTEPKRDSLPSYRPRDKVRVTYDYEVDTHGEVNVPILDNLLTNLTVEVIEPADDPSKDPVGTVRKGHTASMVKVRHNLWHSVRDTANVAANVVLSFSDEEVVGYRVIGAVPGTPAAKALGAAWGCVPWTGDGYTEPPDYVTKVVDRNGDELTRVKPDTNGNSWRRTWYVNGDTLPSGNLAWEPYFRPNGPYTEVLPEEI